MKQIITFGGSNNKKSINKTLATYASHMVEGVEVLQIDLNNFQMPMYSPEEEAESGVPEAAKDLFALIGTSDGVVLSLAEYNGSYTPVFKNTFDWMSRIETKVWQGKPLLLMSTSPGQGGANHVLTQATASFPHFGAEIVATFSLPSFNESFIDGAIENTELLASLQESVASFSVRVTQPEIIK
jgi:chromate reductase